MLYDLVGYEVPLTSNRYYGIRILAYDNISNVLIAIPIKWSNGAVVGEQLDVDVSKFVDRYDVDNKRCAKPRELGGN